jgi:hypothetical protein
MMHAEQTDLSREGHLFSWVIIGLINLLTVLFLLALLAHQFLPAAHLFWLRIEQSYLFTAREFVRVFTWARTEWFRQ